jgi:ABC-type transport system involved in multi-copper enzyme maturation permease subunit
MIRRPHLKLIATHCVRHSLRGGAGLIAILATLTIGLIMASIVISPLEALHAKLHIAQQPSELGGSQMQEVMQIAKKAFGWVMGTSDAQIDYLSNDKPAMVSAILILLTVVTPLFACLAAFNQTSGDNASRGLRYLLIRTERDNIFVGRLIGTAAFMAVVLGILFVILGAYIAAKIHVHPTGDMLLWLLGGYIRLVALTMPYVALCAWVSGSIDSPFGSLMLSLLVAYVWPLFVAVGAANAAWFHYLTYLTPWGYKWWLFSEQPAMVAGGFAVMLAFTVLITGYGLSRFRKRDM